MKRKSLILILLITFTIIVSSFIYAVFKRDKSITLNSASGNVEITNRSYIKYGKYDQVLSGTYSSTTDYYIYNSTYDLYTKKIIASDEFVTDGSLYTYDPNYSSDVLADDGESMNCYATKRKGFSDENANYPYLNSVGFKFNFKSSLAVYLRIEFKDAWKSHKTYSTTNTIDERYIEKDKIEGESPFKYSTDSDWIYDEMNNCAYYKYIIPATCEDISAESATSSSDYVFRVNPAYWYEENINISYREMIIIELSFNVSIIQANRAEKKWDVDFSDLGIVSTTKSGD